MIIRNKKMFGLGMLLAVSFFTVLLLIFTPFFSGGKNGLQFADDTFNRLSKGSSYFIPKVAKSLEKVSGQALATNITLDKAEEAENTAKLFRTAGAQVEVIGAELKISGDLTAVLTSALSDADSMFKNDGKTVSDRYGYDEKTVMRNWWTALGKIDKNFKKEKQIVAAKVVADVSKKAIEPGYNFYKIEGQSVKEHAPMMIGLLVFYVAYTMWWGYSIFYLFDGVGLSMKKAKVKKEA